MKKLSIPNALMKDSCLQLLPGLHFHNVMASVIPPITSSFPPVAASMPPKCRVLSGSWVAPS